MNSPGWCRAIRGRNRGGDPTLKGSNRNRQIADPRGSTPLGLHSNFWPPWVSLRPATLNPRLFMLVPFGDALPSVFSRNLVGKDQIVRGIPS